MFEKIIVYNQMMFLNRSEKVKVSSSYNAFGWTVVHIVWWQAEQKVTGGKMSWPSE